MVTRATRAAHLARRLASRRGFSLVRHARLRARRESLTQAQVGRKYGFRSGLERDVAKQLTDAGVPFLYEGRCLRFVQPAQDRRYSPDFVITTRSGKTIIVETKGLWTREDRLKMKLVVQQHPDLDLRIVFTNPNARISKRSQTTYGAWADKHLGVLWAKGRIPDAWLDE